MVQYSGYNGGVMGGDTVFRIQWKGDGWWYSIQDTMEGLGVVIDYTNLVANISK